MRFSNFTQIILVFAQCYKTASYELIFSPTTNISYTSEEINSMLHKRVFSLSIDKTIEGTGWVSYHLPNNSNDIVEDKIENNYTYYLFTTWVVAKELEIANSFEISWSDSEETSISVSHTIDATNILKEWKYAPANYYGLQEKVFGCDITLLEIDFSSFVIDDEQLKTRLDKLNEYGDEHDNFLFNGFINYENVNLSDELFLGAYPAKDMVGHNYVSPQWEFGNTLVEEKYDNFYSDVRWAQKSTTLHDIGSTTKYESVVSMGDIFVGSEQTRNVTDFLSNFGVGSGGGIAVNNNFNLAGIYWGNFSEVIKGVNYLYPSFETLSWNEHNILDDFLNNGLGVKEPKYFHFQIEDEIKWILPLIISIGMILGITSVLLLCYDWRKKKIKVYRRHRKNHSKDKGYIETGESENNDEGDCASLK